MIEEFWVLFGFGFVFVCGLGAGYFIWEVRE